MKYCILLFLVIVASATEVQKVRTYVHLIPPKGKSAYVLQAF